VLGQLVEGLELALDLAPALVKVHAMEVVRGGLDMIRGTNPGTFEI
jgi:hypothetical protein